MGGIGLENHAETRDFGLVSNPVTPKATPFERQFAAQSQFPGENQKNCDLYTGDWEAIQKSSIQLIANRWDTLPQSIRAAILVLVRP